MLKKLRSVSFINRIIAWIIKFFNLKQLEPRWPLKGIFKFNILDKSVVFYSNCDDYLISNFYYQGSNEETIELEILKSFINPSDTFFDVGSYNGLFSVVLGKKYPTLNICSFEPNPSNFSRLKHNISLNGLTNINAYNIGISQATGKMDFYVPENLSLTTVSSFNENFFLRHSVNSAIKREVAVNSIDIFCKENNTYPDLIKIDVEGHEYEVITGGFNTLESHRPIILCEVFAKSYESNRRWQEKLPKVFEINELLKKLNYKIFLMQNRQLKEVKSLNVNNPERNFFFIPTK